MKIRHSLPNMTQRAAALVAKRRRIRQRADTQAIQHNDNRSLMVHFNFSFVYAPAQAQARQRISTAMIWQSRQQIKFFQYS